MAYLTADREFRGKNWLQFLVDEHIPFCIRIPNNTKVWNKHRSQRLPVSRLLGLQRNEQMNLKKQRDIWGISVYLSCIMGKQGHVIVATNEQPQTAIKRYAIRWSIETLFGCLKSRGFDLESTHLQQLERLEKLFFVCALALAWSFKLGILQNKLKPLKLRKHGRKPKSLFRLGLDYLHRVLVEGSAHLSEFRHSLKVLSCT